MFKALQNVSPDRTAAKLLHPMDTPAGEWERDAADRFGRRLLAKDVLFPCVFGVDALRKGTLRFTFVPGGEQRTEYLAGALEDFVKVAAELGRRTSLVAFFEPTEGLETLVDYERHSWSLLQDLHVLDSRPWPGDIPKDTENPEWEFSFAGMPMFVVVNTPAHQKRMSRFFEYFCITFQPRFVFDDISESSLQGKNARHIIRGRLRNYDDLPPTPLLGSYGAPGNREWTQYFLDDDNSGVPESTRCPFHVTSSNEEDA